MNVMDIGVMDTGEDVCSTFLGLTFQKLQSHMPTHAAMNQKKKKDMIGKGFIYYRLGRVPTQSKMKDDDVIMH